MMPRRLDGPPREPGWYIVLPVLGGIFHAPIRRLVRRDNEGHLMFAPDAGRPQEADVRAPSFAGWEWEGPFDSREETFIPR